MCVVSNVGDDYSRRRLPDVWPTQWPPFPTPSSPPLPLLPKYVKVEEFERLRAEVEQMRRDLEAAKRQDIAEGNPDCEMDDKVKIVKEIARLVGVDLSEVFPND